MSLIHLPEESLCSIAQFLEPSDVLHFISIHPTYIPLLCHSKQFWAFLNQVHYFGENIISDDIDSDVMNCEEKEDWKAEKKRYLLRSYCNTLSDVRWYSIKTKPPRSLSARHLKIFSYAEPSAREGHVSCIIGNYLVLTGGFTDDDDIYIKHLHHLHDGTTWRRISLMQPKCQQNPMELSKNWVYGATLTSFNDTSAIMFGGFQSGGYSNETSQVAILHLEEEEGSCDRLAAHGSVIKAWWEVTEGHVANDEDCAASTTTVSKCNDTDRSFLRIAGRAYHAATLLFDRYLFIVGGMQSRGSILNPLLLDCYTWTWYLDGITSCNSNAKPSAAVVSSASSRGSSQPISSPSERHGCSMIADVQSHRNNRLLLFGGGSGTDLLRSGIDNTEVWELLLNGCESAKDVLTSLPWNWNILHYDQADENEEEEDNEDNEEEDDEIDNGNDEGENNPNCLSSVEQLNLGRCHGGYRVGRDMVVLAFGSGRPTTNSILCYNLKNDSFFRARVHPSFIPRGRFTFASAFIESKGIIVFHGGFSTQRDTDSDGDTLSDTILLDLAPTVNSHASNGRLWLPIDYRAKTYSISTIPLYQARRSQMNGDSMLAFFSYLCSQLIGEANETQREISTHLLSVMDESRRTNSMGQIVSLFADGQLLIGEDGALIFNDIIDPDSESLIRSLL